MPRYPSHHKAARPRPPLDRAALDALALRYVAKYATTRAKLAAYLQRKLMERGWTDEAGAAPPDIAAIVERMAEQRYVDDAAFATARGAALGRRGYGARRVTEDLRAAGVDADDGADAHAAAEAECWASALAFARRRRLGPYAREAADPDRQRRDLAAMLRAGHAMAVARRIVRAHPGEEIGDDAP